MQNKHLTLREIIWELTSECKNGCTYCGSKANREIPTDEKRIIDIANEIAKYPPLEIDMSGGDPLLVSLDTHRTITGILKEKNVLCKILINPFSIKDESNWILDLYDWVGISINTEKELNKLRSITPFGASYLSKSTVITNFNLTNIFEYDKIEAFVKEYNLLWTIQYTVEENRDSVLSIFNNESGLRHLEDKIKNSLSTGTKIILSDNMTTTPCGAGSSSIGLTYNGEVVPCLSMRSWLSCNDFNKEVVGNILTDTLEGIWINGFNKYRFCSFECCKDACKNKTINLSNIIVNEPEPKIEPPFETFKPIPIDRDVPYTLMYGVRPMNIVAYAVTPNLTNRTVLYAVSSGLNHYIYGVASDMTTNGMTGKYTKMCGKCGKLGDECDCEK